MKVIKENKVIDVTEKAFRVVYKGLGYKVYVEKEQEPQENGEETPIDFADLSDEELKKINNDDLRAYLDENDVEFDSKAIKDELINLIKG